MAPAVLLRPKSVPCGPLSTSTCSTSSVPGPTLPTLTGAPSMFTMTELSSLLPW